MVAQHAVDPFHHVDAVLVRQRHVRGVDNILQLLELPGRLLDDAGISRGDGGQFRGREVVIDHHALIAVDVDVGDLPDEQHALLDLAGRADQVVDRLPCRVGRHPCGCFPL